MSARLFIDTALLSGLDLSLPAGAARHVQVLRMQPGEELTLFNGQGGEWRARITGMGRSDVQVTVESFAPVERELAVAVTLVAGMPANERFDWLVEKATELGAAAILPTVCERSVLRLSGERAHKKREHWQAVAVAAAQQSGRNRVPTILPVGTLAQHLTATRNDLTALRLTLSLREAAPLELRLRACEPGVSAVHLFSGPEGGFTEAEEDLLHDHGALATTLGPAVLRSETAPLAALAYLSMRPAGR